MAGPLREAGDHSRKSYFTVTLPQLTCENCTAKRNIHRRSQDSSDPDPTTAPGETEMGQFARPGAGRRPN